MRRFSPWKIVKHSKQNVHSAYGGDCDAVIAKSSAAGTHVQSHSQEVGSGEEGLGFFSFFFFVISRNGLLVTGGRAVKTSPLIFMFRMTSCVYRGSG